MKFKYRDNVEVVDPENFFFGLVGIAIDFHEICYDTHTSNVIKVNFLDSNGKIFTKWFNESMLEKFV